MFKKASKVDVDNFMSKGMLDDNIYPYLSTTKYFGTFDVPDDDWGGLLITNDSNTFISKVTFRRTDEVGMVISLYAVSSFSAGRALSAINEIESSEKILNETVQLAQSIDDKNGFIVPEKKPEMIAEKLKLLIENPELRKQMGLASFNLYLTNFTEEKMIDKYTATFNAILK